MIKFIVTKELEIDEDSFESDAIGVFDTEDEAKKSARSIYEAMSECEKQYYDIMIWKVPEDSIKEDDEGLFFTEGKGTVEFSEVAAEDEDGFLEENEFDSDKIVHFCPAPLNDGVRVWIGDNPDLYVDRILLGFPDEIAYCLRDWFKQYGQFVEESWKECFPKRMRNWYIRKITSKGYSDEEASEIIRYLPQTDCGYIAGDVSNMIDLWERKAKIIEPYRMPLWKKNVLQRHQDLWESDVVSPRAEKAWKEGWLQGRAELVKSLSKETNKTHKEIMEMLEVKEQDQVIIMELINGGGENEIHN